MPSTPNWIILIGFATKLVLLLLLVLSVWSGSIMIDRRRRLKTYLAGDPALRARAMVKSGDLEGLRKWADGGATLQASAMREILAAPANAEAIAYAQRSFLTDERASLVKGLPFLATLGSNAPFIGLFGTVLGIIQSFGALATSSSAMNQVIFALAESLLSTAVGLFVAIPAVVAYNIFSQRIKTAVDDAESLRDLYLSHFILKGRA